MEAVLVKIYYHLILILLAGMALGLLFLLVENRKIFKFIPESTWLRLFLIMILAIVARFVLTSFFPNVFNDEFLYMATAENMARTGLSSPFLQRSYPPQPLGFELFLPPYPQLWPALLSLMFRIAGKYTFQTAVDFNMILSFLVTIPAFFTGYFLFLPLERRQKLQGLAVQCGLYNALFWSLLPVLIKMTGCASSEVCSILFINIFTALLFFYMQYPTTLSLFSMILSLSLVINGRPENLLYLLLLIPVLARTHFRILREKRNWAFLILIFYVFLSLVILTSGSADIHRNFVFENNPRPAFNNSFDNFRANLFYNLLFLFGYHRVNPIFYTLLFLGGLFFLLWRDRENFTGYLLLGWFLLFYLIFTPFPFGDFSNTHSFDAYRFSLHLYLPMLLAMSYCAHSIFNMFENSRFQEHRKTVTFGIIVVSVISLIFSMSFLKITHPDGFYFDTLNKVANEMNVGRENVIMIGERIDLCLLNRYATGIPTYLIENHLDMKTFQQGNAKIYYYCIDNPSELILRNFDIQLFTRHQEGGKEYSVFSLKKL